MDHHCPFLNNCVGRGNMRPFLLFLFWVMLAMVYAMTMLTVSIYKHRKTLKRVRNHTVGVPLPSIVSLHSPYRTNHMRPALLEQRSGYYWQLYTSAFYAAGSSNAPNHSINNTCACAGLFCSALAALHLVFTAP